MDNVTDSTAAGAWPSAGRNTPVTLINRGTDVDEDCADWARTGTWDTSRMTAPVNTAYSCRMTDSFNVSVWSGTGARRHARVMGQSHQDSGAFVFRSVVAGFPHRRAVVASSSVTSRSSSATRCFSGSVSAFIPSSA